MGLELIALIVAIVAIIVSVVAAILLQPKPQNVAPIEFEDLEAPTAEEGREIPVVFGTRIVKGANVVWYGDLTTTKVKKKP